MGGDHGDDILSGDGIRETREIGCDASEVSGKSTEVDSVRVSIPTGRSVGVNVGHSVVTFSNKVIVAEHHADDRGEENRIGGEIGGESVA